TRKTITDKTVLVSEVKKVGRRGYAMSEEEFLPGLIAIAAPLFGPGGKGIGAVSFDFSVIEHSADDIEAKYADMIRTAAGSLSDLLPYDGKSK
ncbi:MAG: hypothetical protein GY859_24565, partial [Desulfobacterales bacterium]|nr:hypothetical protein [Desulfobacterales bacterium]